MEGFCLKANTDKYHTKELNLLSVKRTSEEQDKNTESQIDNSQNAFHQ